MVIVDDAVLVDLLAGVVPPAVGAEDLATTNTWWYRLAAAMARARESDGGRLAGRFTGLAEPHRLAVERTVARLDSLLLVQDLRPMIRAMAALTASHGVNLSSAEALVAAEHLEATLVLGVANPPLMAAADDLGIPCVVA